jgi:hypothetical protein
MPHIKSLRFVPVHLIDQVGVFEARAQEGCRDRFEGALCHGRLDEKVGLWASPEASWIFGSLTVCVAPLGGHPDQSIGVTLSEVVGAPHDVHIGRRTLAAGLPAKFHHSVALREC